MDGGADLKGSKLVCEAVARSNFHISTFQSHMLCCVLALPISRGRTSSAVVVGLKCCGSSRWPRLRVEE